jgi:hypothetical protein
MRRRVTAISLLLFATSLVGLSAAKADSGTAKTRSEAWYNITPAGTPSAAPAGAAVVPPTYGTDTLHVGVTQGQEDSRTYFVLDTSAIDSDATLNGGTLRVPVDPGDGSRSPDTARIQACFVAQPPPEAAGSLKAPPPYDCQAANSVGTYLGGDAPAFIFDLAPFASKLRSGGIVIVPTDGAKAAGDSWHVTIYGSHNTSAGAQPITASVQFTPAPSSSDEAASAPSVESSPVEFPQPAAVVAQPSEVVPAQPEIGVPPPAPTVTPILGNTQVSANDAVNAVSSISGGFSYSAIWFLPLVIAALGWLLAWALTRSPVPEDV